MTRRWTGRRETGSVRTDVVIGISTLIAGLVVTWAGINDWRIFPAPEDGPGEAPSTSRSQSATTVPDDEGSAGGAPDSPTSTAPPDLAGRLFECIVDRFPDSYGYQLNQLGLARDEIGKPTPVRISVDPRDSAYTIATMNDDCHSFTDVLTVQPGEERRIRVPQGSLLQVLPTVGGIGQVVLGPVSSSAPLGYGGASFAYETTNILWAENLEEVGG